jgi:hypothetical protein
VFHVVCSYRVGKVITCPTLWIYIVGDIHGLFNVITKIELSRGIGESFCLFYDSSLVSSRTPRSHELF